MGLAFAFAGSILLAWGMFISRSRAIDIGSTKFAGETDEARLKDSTAQYLLKQNVRAIIGTILLAIGFFLQLIANWPRIP